MFAITHIPQVDEDTLLKFVDLINITGKDKPGLTSSLTNILAQYDVTILDIGQAVIHDYLSLGILVEIPGQPGAQWRR